MSKMWTAAIALALSAGIAKADDATFRAAGKLHAVRIEATGQRFEPMQNITPYSPSRHVSNYHHTVIWSPKRQQAREDWQLTAVYPFPGTWTFAAAYDKDHGAREGQDGWRPSPGGAVEPARVGAVLKDLWLANPTMVIAQGKPLASEQLPDGSRREQWQAGGAVWTLIRDGAGLVRQASTREADPLFGQVENRADFDDWREVDGVPFPFRLAQYVDGKLIKREIRVAIAGDPEGWAADVQTPAGDGKAQPGDPDLVAWGQSMSQFFLRRAVMGAPADEDQSVAVKFSEVANGVYQVLGSSHNNLIIEGPDGLLIADAVWYPRRSRAILAAMREKWPNKQLKYVVLTHHHLDHDGGLAPYAESGATIVVAAANRPFFAGVLDATIDQPPPVLAVGDRAVLDGIGRRLETLDIPNSHASGMLALYVPDAKLAYNTDLYSPGRPTQQPVWARELRDAYAFYGIDILVHVGGHGVGTKPNEDLIAVVEGN